MTLIDCVVSRKAGAVRSSSVHFPSTVCTAETHMSNPWLKKNPFMSMWLSNANRAANTVRAQSIARPGSRPD